MTNRPLVIVLGAIAVAYIAALSAILVLYDGDKLAVAGILSGAMALLIPQMLSLKQSADNNQAITRVSDKIDSDAVQTKLAIGGIAQQVDANTQLTEKVEGVANVTHDAVNGQTEAYKKLIEDMAKQQILTATIEARLNEALARAEGITTGRGQAAETIAAAGLDQKTPTEPSP